MDAEWTREGMCCHCGWCCVATAQTTVVVTLSPSADVLYYQTRGFTLLPTVAAPQEARARVDVVLRCPQWTGELGVPGCRVYAARPRTCQEFPRHPDAIVATPCSYWFERRHGDGQVERRGGRGSPYPLKE